MSYISWQVFKILIVPLIKLEFNKHIVILVKIYLFLFYKNDIAFTILCISKLGLVF